MRILLIGGTGFIGQYLAKKLNARVGCEVIVAYNNRLLLKEKFGKVCYVHLDLSKLNKPGKRLVNSVEIIVILTQPNEKIIDNLIAAIKLAGHFKKIIYLSSLLVYDNFSGKQSEKLPLKPATDYERGKQAEELKLSRFVQGNSFKLCVARLANVYGDVKNKGIINFIFQALLNDGEVIVNGKGDSVRDYIFIEDAVRWLVFLIFYKQKNKKEIFNLCSGQGHSVKNLIRAVESLTKKKIKKITGTSIKEKKMIIVSNKKVIKFSGRKLKYNLSKGLAKTYKNYQAKKSDS